MTFENAVKIAHKEYEKLWGRAWIDDRADTFCKSWTEPDSSGKFIYRIQQDDICRVDTIPDTREAFADFLSGVTSEDEQEMKHCTTFEFNVHSPYYKVLEHY